MFVHKIHKRLCNLFCVYTTERDKEKAVCFRKKTVLCAKEGDGEKAGNGVHSKDKL